MKGFFGALFVFALWTTACIYYINMSESNSSMSGDGLSPKQPEILETSDPDKTVASPSVNISSEIKEPLGQNKTDSQIETSDIDTLDFQKNTITRSESKLLADELMKSISISDTIDFERDEPELTIESKINIEPVLDDNSSTFYPTYRNTNLIIDSDLVAYVQELRSIIKKDPSKRITIIGHTDNVGNAKDNFATGLKKARQVKWYLTVKRGLPRNKIKAVSRGENDPIESNNSVRGRKKNNRVQIIVS